jgi:ribosomal protein S18 acetylase RimI-like enzyme
VALQRGLGLEGLERDPEAPDRPAATPLAARQCRPAAKLLARAFRDNPLNCAVIPGGPDRRLRCNYHGMRASLAGTYGHAEILAAAAGDVGLSGVLISAPPFGYPFPRPPLFAQLRCLIGQGFEVQRRWSSVYRRLQPIHPFEPHWYLSVLGVDPAHQRQGVGSALLGHWLRQVDESGEPSYLETDREESVRFYQRAGFEVAEELKIFNVEIWCMRRPASDATHDDTTDTTDTTTRGTRAGIGAAGSRASS